MPVNGAGVIFSINNSLTLLVKGRHSGKWSFPKGSCETGESLVQTAMREMREETGIEVVLGQSDHAIVFNGSRSHRCYFLCDPRHVRLYSHPIYLKPTDNREISEIRWFHPWEIMQMKRRQVNCDVWQWVHITNQATYLSPLQTHGFKHNSTRVPAVVPTVQNARPCQRRHRQVFERGNQVAGKARKWSVHGGRDHWGSVGPPVASVREET